MNVYGYAAAIAAVGICAAPAAAQEQVPPTAAQERPVDDDDDGGAHGFFAVGPGAVPKYDGADKYELIPFAIMDVEWKNIEFQLRGLGARANLLADSAWQVGPAVNLRFKRDSSKDGDGRVKFLNDIDTAVEVGGFVGYRFGGDPTGLGEVTVDLTVLKDVKDGHDGTTATARASYGAYRSRKLFVNVDTQANFGDAKYTRAYFGVTPQEALRSGLAAYRPKGGLTDVGAGVTLGYQFSERWGVLARLGADYYVGDAQDSPIVKDGSKVQGIGGLALSYRF